MGTQEQIQELEEELKKTKVNKRTEGSIGLLKARIARLKEKREQSGKGGKKPQGYAVRRSGDSTVILVGFPSVGKSTLLNALTNKESQVAAYAFTTLTCIPGLMEHKDAKIQILDVPGIVTGAAAGSGRGKEVLAVIQNADLIVFVIDALHPEHLDVLQREVYDTHVRVNQSKPDVTIKKVGRGGLDIGMTVRLTHINRSTIESILREFGIANAQVVIREDVTAEQLVDVIQGNKIYRPALTVVNKADLISAEERKTIVRDIRPDVFISAEKRQNLESFKDAVFDKLNFIRVYCKEYGKDADMNEALIIRAPATVRSMCEKLHKEFVRKYRYSRIWGSSKFPGQRFTKIDVPIHDKDVVEIRIR